MSTHSLKILACHHLRQGPKTSCAARGALAISELLGQQLATAGLAVAIEPIYCFGMCDEGPVLRVVPAGPFFRHLDEAAVDEVIDYLRLALKRE